MTCPSMTARLSETLSIMHICQSCQRSYLAPVDDIEDIIHIVCFLRAVLQAVHQTDSSQYHTHSSACTQNGHLDLNESNPHQRTAVAFWIEIAMEHQCDCSQWLEVPLHCTAVCCTRGTHPLLHTAIAGTQLSGSHAQSGRVTDAVRTSRHAPSCPGPGWACQAAPQQHP